MCSWFGVVIAALQGKGKLSLCSRCKLLSCSLGIGEVSTTGVIVNQLHVISGWHASAGEQGALKGHQQIGLIMNWQKALSIFSD